MRSIVNLGVMVMAGYLANIYAMIFLLKWIPLLQLIVDGQSPWPSFLLGFVTAFMTTCAAWHCALMPLIQHVPPWLLAQISKDHVVRMQQVVNQENLLSMRFSLWHITPKRKAFFTGTLSIVALGLLALVYKLLIWQPQWPVLSEIHPVLATAILTILVGLVVRLVQGALFLRGWTVLVFGPDAQWHFQGQSYDLWSAQFAVIDHDRSLAEASSEKKGIFTGERPGHKYREAVQLVAYTTAIPCRVDIAEFSDRREAEDALLALIQAQQILLEMHGAQPVYGA